MPPVLSYKPATDPLLAWLPQVQAGDGRAVEGFVRAIGPPILHVTRQILGTRHPDVPDIVQEATFAVIDSLVRFRGESSVLHFVWRVSVLTAMNARRRARLRERSTADMPDYDTIAGSDLSPLGLTVAARRREAFRQLIDALPAAQAEALSMHCVLGWTIEEAAEATGIPANTVRSRLVTAKAALRRRLAEDPELYELLRGAS